MSKYRFWSGREFDPRLQSAPHSVVRSGEGARGVSTRSQKSVKGNVPPLSQKVGH